MELAVEMAIFSWLVPTWRAKDHEFDELPPAAAASSSSSAAAAVAGTASLDTHEPQTQLCFNVDAAPLQWLQCVKDSLSPPVCLLLISIVGFLLLLAYTGRFNGCIRRLRVCWPWQQATRNEKHVGGLQSRFHSCAKRAAHCSACWLVPDLSGHRAVTLSPTQLPCNSLATARCWTASCYSCQRLKLTASASYATGLCLCFASFSRPFALQQSSRILTSSCSRRPRLWGGM